MFGALLVELARHAWRNADFVARRLEQGGGLVAAEGVDVEQERLQALGALGVFAPFHQLSQDGEDARADAVAQFLFADPATRRVVAEPDASNWRAVRRMQRTGFELGPQIRLPDKTAQLAFLTREALQGARARGGAAADPNQRT